MSLQSQIPRERGSGRNDVPLAVAVDAASRGIVAAAILSTLTSVVLALMLRHLFVPRVALVPWLLTVWGWYVLGFAGGATCAALVIVIVRRLVDYDAVNPLPNATMPLVVVGFFALHAALVLNFYVLSYDIALDATRGTANAVLSVATLACALLVLRGRRAHATSSRDRGRAAACIAAAVLALGAARVLPGARDPIAARPQVMAAKEAVATAVATALPARRNVLLITVDTLRADHLGAFGYQRDTSPFIDRLAAEGTLFEDTFVEKPITSPSFASLMTGTHARRHGVRGASQVLAAEHVTLAETLKAAGFATAAVITNGNLFPVFGFDQGFDFYDHQPNVTGRSRDADEVTDVAIAWLERDTPQPFFLWVHYVDPHDPYRPADEYQRRYVGDALYEEIPLEPGACEPCAGSSPGVDEFANDPDTNLAWHLAQYDAEIRFTNDQLERFLLAYSEHYGLDRTLLVFTADHGESFGEHGAFGHGTTAHHSNTHVPLFFRLPGVVPAGKRISEPVSNVDVVPTVLDLVGIPIPAAVQGRSHARRIRGETGATEDAAAVIEAGFGRHVGRGLQHALRTDDWCYVWRDTRWALQPDSPADVFWIWNALLEGGLDPDELYHIEEDPAETNNLITAGLPVAEQLRSRLYAELVAQGPESAGAKALDHSALKRADPSLESQLRELGYIDD